VSVFGKPLDVVASTDIEALKSTGAQESQYLDYKRDAYGSDTKELLRDITSFANAYGGEVIVGVEEDGDGRPQSIPGLNEYKLECTRYEQSAMTGIDPRIPGLKVYAVPFADPAKGVIIVSVPRSSRAPHMVTVGGEDRFWRRHGRHKSRMTTADIGESFRFGREYLKLSEDYLEGAKRAALNSGISEPRLVLGALPALQPERPIGPGEAWAREILARPHGKQNRASLLPEMDPQHEEIRPTLRGLVRLWRAEPQQPSLALHRNGYLELRNRCITGIGGVREDEIEFGGFASLCVDFFRLASQVYHKLGYEGEVFAFGAIAKTEGLRLRDMPVALTGGSDHRSRDADPRGCPEVPNLVVEPWSYSTSETPESQAQRFADVVYNAFGHERAPSIKDSQYGHV